MEQNWEHILKIKTTGRDDTISNHINYPYEPTSYLVLERIAGAGILDKTCNMIDYGCGKGRVSLFLAYQTKCHVIGIDYDERMVAKAKKNQEQLSAGRRVQFLQENAVHFAVPFDVNVCYFFNPFSVEVLQSVVARIMESYYEQPRTITLLFYYPSEEYRNYLNGCDSIQYIEDISCADLFDKKDARECVAVYQIGDEK